MTTAWLDARPHDNSEIEWPIRLDAARALRLIGARGWDDWGTASLTVRVLSQGFLTKPKRALASEVTAAALQPVEQAMLPELNRRAHEARPDAMCVIHLATVHGIAASLQTEAALPLVEEHDLNFTEGNSFLIPGRGTLAIGTTVHEAFLAVAQAEQFAAIQIAAGPHSRPLQNLPRIGTSIWNRQV